MNFLDMKTLFEGKKLYAVIIAFLLIIVFFITFHIIRNHYQYVFRNVITENTLTANLLSSLIYEHQKAAISILESYAQRPLFIDAVKKKDFNHVIPHLKSLSEHHTEIDALFITDKYGTLWANYPVDSKGFGKNLAYRDWYKGVSKKWRPYISSVYRLIVLEKGLAVALSVPVLDRKGNIIGILSGAHRTAFLATFIRANTLDFRKSITLLDQEGNIIFSNAVPYQEKITKYPDAHVLEKALAGVIIDMEIADAKEKGSISYVSIAPVKGIGWSVIVGQEKNAILKSLYRYFILSAVAGFVIFLFLAVSLLYFRREYKYRKTKELQASEELYRTLFNETLDGICLADAETGIIFDCNQALEALVCRERTELIGRPQTILHPPQDDKEAFSLTFKQHLTDKQGQILETQIVTRTGDIREVEIKANFVVLHGRKLLQGLFCDITERKRAEEALRESEEIFSQFMNYSPIYVFFKDENIKTIRLSKNYTEMLGRPISELLGKNMDDLFPSDLAKSMVADDKRILKEGKKIEIEEELNGRFYSTIKFPIYREGKPAYLAGFTVDITDRKRAEEEKRRMEERSHKLVDDVFRFIPEGVLVFSRKMELLRQNQAFRELVSGYAKRLGFAEDELENLIIDKVKAGLRDNNIKEIKIARKHETREQT